MTIRQTRVGAIDPAEFAGWLTGLQPDLYRFAARLTAIAADTADLVQGTTVRALEKRRLFAGEAPDDLRRWLYRMMVNLHCDHVRRRGREVAGKHIDEFPALFEPVPFWATIDEADVTAAVERLQPRLRTAYQLYAVDRRETEAGAPQIPNDLTNLHSIVLVWNSLQSSPVQIDGINRAAGSQ